MRKYLMEGANTDRARNEDPRIWAKGLLSISVEYRFGKVPVLLFTFLDMSHKYIIVSSTWTAVQVACRSFNNTCEEY